MEKYLLVVRDHKLRRSLSQVSSHKLCIETGRHSKSKLALDQRLCKFCDFKEVESEAHFMMHCSLYQEDRIKLFTNVLMEDFSVIIDDDSQI